MKIITLFFVLFAGIATNTYASESRFNYQGLAGIKTDSTAEYSTIPLTIDLKESTIVIFDILVIGGNCASKQWAFCFYSPQLIFSLPKHKIAVDMHWWLIKDDTEILFTVKNKFILKLFGMNESVYLIDAEINYGDDETHQRFYYSEAKGLRMFTELNSPDTFYWSTDPIGLAAKQ